MISTIIFTIEIVLAVLTAVFALFWFCMCAYDPNRTQSHMAITAFFSSLFGIVALFGNQVFGTIIIAISILLMIACIILFIKTEKSDK